MSLHPRVPVRVGRTFSWKQMVGFRLEMHRLVWIFEVKAFDGKLSGNLGENRDKKKLSKLIQIPNRGFFSDSKLILPLTKISTFLP